MASLISSMAREVFQILKGSGRTLSLFDEHGNKVFEPEAAISFFAEPDKLMLSIDQNGADSALNMYVSDSADIDQMKKMLDTMRMIATRHNFLFNVRKYGKDLNPKDFAFKATPMMESMWGSAKTSYQTIGSAKLIVRHSSKIAEEVRGARSRRIHSIFVETENGERFRCPMNSLHGARAYARHLTSGGTPSDDFSRYIFAECEMQGKINNVRRHIRKLNSANEAVIDLAETLTDIVGASKARIAKSKGNRFYTGIVEQITNAPNHIGPLASEISEQVEYLKDILQIDETNSLFPILESVAKTILETKQMNPINFEEETLISEYVAENADLIADLIESLVGEFGLEEGVHFDCYEPTKLSVLSEEAMDGAQMYLQGFDGFTLHENPQDKFLMYATQWVKKRFAKAGMDAREVEQADVQKQATELATGLKQVIAGALNVRVKGGEMPRFASQEAAISYKLDKLLAPGSGLGNDMLWNFVSTLSDKLGNGDSMDQNERFFATKLAGIVDNAAVKENAINPEMSALEEWMGSLDEAGPYDVVPGDAQMEQALDNFDTEDFLNFINSDLNKLMDFDDPDDRTISRNAVVGMVYHYLEQILNDHGDGIEIDRYEPQIEAFIDSDIIPALEKINVYAVATEGLDETLFAEAEVDEAFGNSGSSFSPAFIEELKNQIAKLEPSEYIGLQTGDDADEAAMNLTNDIIRNLGHDLQSDLFDSWDEVAELAKSIWYPNEAIEEAGNYPDDYNDARNPHNADGASDEIFDELQDFVHETVANPPEGSTLSKVTSDWFDGDADEDLLDDLASDVVGYAIEFSERSFDNDYVSDDMPHFGALAKVALKKKFFPNEEALDERDDNLASHNRLVLTQLIEMIPTFIKRAGNSVDAVFAEMQEYYMDHRTMGPMLYKNEYQIKQEIHKALNGVSETIEAGADQGDDFISDIAYSGDQGDELEHIARLRKLAGI